MASEPFQYSAKLAYLMAACCDPRLVKADLAVLAVLTGCANITTRDAFPSVARIGADSKVPKTTILRSLKRLEGAGWLKSKKRNGAHSVYNLLEPSLATGSEDGTGAALGTGATQNLRRGKTGATLGTEAVPRSEPEQKEKQKQVEKSSPTDSNYVGRFSEFYAAYPRKEGKQAAEKVWQKAGCEAIADTVISAVRARVADPGQWKELKFVPLPATYLNQQRWTDQWKPSANVVPMAGRLPRDARPQAEIDRANDEQMEQFGFGGAQ